LQADHTIGLSYCSTSSAARLEFYFITGSKNPLVQKLCVGFLAMSVTLKFASSKAHPNLSNYITASKPKHSFHHVFELPITKKSGFANPKL
jgi:hypothetical protein